MAGIGGKIGAASLGMGIGSAIGGLASGDAPTAQAVDLDSGTKGLIKEQADQALKGPSDIYNSMTDGESVAKNQFNDQLSQQNNAAMGGGNSATSQAIQNKYANALGSDIEDYKNRASYGAQLESAHRLMKAQANVRAQAAVKQHAYSMQMEAQRRSDQMRAQVISSVLGIAGKVGGMYAGGMFDSKTSTPVQNGGGGGASASAATGPMSMPNDFDGGSSQNPWD